MKRSHSLIQSQFQDDQFGTFSQEKQIEFSEKILWDAKIKLQEFIQYIGNLKDIPCYLQKYQNDFNRPHAFQIIDVSLLLNHMSNTIRKMLTNKKIKSNWNKDDLVILLWVIQKYTVKFNKLVINYTDEDWNTISTMIPGKTGQQCMFKWLNLKTNRKYQKYPWSSQQDKLLRKYANQHCYNHWFEISKKLYLKNQQKIYRTPKQCRERWGCYLNPQIKKGQWKPLEDYILITKCLQFGKKWSQIIKLLKGRTQNAVKNRYNLLLSKFEKNTKKIQSSSSKIYFENYIKELEEMHQLDPQMIKKIQITVKPFCKSLKHIKFSQTQSSSYIPQQEPNILYCKTEIQIPEIKQQELQLQNQRDYNECLLQVNYDEQNKQFFEMDTGFNLCQNSDGLNLMTNLSEDFFFGDYDMDY